MATQWFMEGPWFKNCNCDPGCPCDFNQFPTQDHCEGMVGMRITKGKFGGVDLSGLHWAGVVRWPGAMHEGNGELPPIVDVKATDEQRAALYLKNGHASITQLKRGSHVGAKTVG